MTNMALYANQTSFSNQIHQINDAVSIGNNKSDVVGYHNVRNNFNTDISIANPQFQEADVMVMDYPGIVGFEGQGQQQEEADQMQE